MDKKKKQPINKPISFLHLNTWPTILLHILAILFIVIYSIALYANTLKNGFVYDDSVTIVNNAFIKDFSNLYKLFTKDYFPLSSEITYRPLVTFSYFLDYAIYGLKARGFHLTNLLLHAANAALLYLFLTLFLNRNGAKNQWFLKNQPFVVSLLFATHPVLTEAVNAISFREDLLAFFFYLAALNLYILLRANVIDNRRFLYSSFLYTISCILYFLALLSKEMAVTLPLIVCCYEWLCVDEKNGKLHSRLLNHYNTGYFIILFAYTICLCFYYFYNPIEANIHPWSITDRLLTVPALLLNYLKLIIFPISLSADYEIIPIGYFFSCFFILTFIVSASLLSIAFTIKKQVEISPSASCSS